MPVSGVAEASPLCHAALEKSGAPAATRTRDPRLRRPVLYPTELRARDNWSCRQQIAVIRPRALNAVSTESHDHIHNSSDLTRLFINDGRYLRWSNCTVEAYERALNSFGATPSPKTGLSAWVVTLRQRGLSVTTVNIMARAVSSYLTWLHAEGHRHERLRIEQLPNPPKPIKVFSDAKVRRIITSSGGPRALFAAQATDVHDSPISTALIAY